MLSADDPAAGISTNKAKTTDAVLLRDSSLFSPLTWLAYSDIAFYGLFTAYIWKESLSQSLELVIRKEDGYQGFRRGFRRPPVNLGLRAFRADFSICHKAARPANNLRSADAANHRFQWQGAGQSNTGIAKK